MRRVRSFHPLERVEYRPRESKGAEALLRENVTQEEFTDRFGELRTRYVADEVAMETELSEAEVIERFDELWVAAEAADSTLEARVAELEDMLGAVVELALGGDANGS